jgi:hypothetical protein
MEFNNINVRFFTYCFDVGSDEVDILEITENQFIALAENENSKITYERHTVFQNGCSQICLTVEPMDFPYSDEIELKET